MASAAIRDRSGRTAIIAVSVLAHGLVLALLGLSSPALREVRRLDPRAVELELWPLPEERLTARPAAAAAARPSPIRPRRAVAPAPPATLAPVAAAPALTRPAPPAAGGPPVQAGVGGVDGLRQALRGSSVGCANRDAVGLTRREREACDEALGRSRGQAADLAAPLDPAMRADWDAVAARKAAIRRRKEGPVPAGISTNDNAGGTRTNGLGILGY